MRYPCDIADLDSLHQSEDYIYVILRLDDDNNCDRVMGSESAKLLGCLENEKEKYEPKTQI